MVAIPIKCPWKGRPRHIASTSMKRGSAIVARVRATNGLEIGLLDDILLGAYCEGKNSLIKVFRAIIADLHGGWTVPSTNRGIDAIVRKERHPTKYHYVAGGMTTCFFSGSSCFFSGSFSYLIFCFNCFSISTLDSVDFFFSFEKDKSRHSFNLAILGCLFV